MVTMAKGGSSILLFNLQKMLHHRITVLSITALLAFYVLWQAGSLVWKFWHLDQESTPAAALAPRLGARRFPRSKRQFRSGRLPLSPSMRSRAVRMARTNSGRS